MALGECYRLTDGWLDEVHEETQSPPSSLSGSERRFFQDYYAHLIDPRRRAFFKHHLAQRLAAVLYHVQQLEPSSRILDVGCGVGTQALLFARLGHVVTGIDVFAREIAIAGKRLEFYRSRWKLPVAVTLQTTDATHLSVQELGQYRCLHIFEALSHIHPMERFLEAMQLLVAPGGYVVLSDTNGFNPLVRLALWRRTGQWSYSVRVLQDSTTGHTVQYAFKRVMSPVGMRVLLARYGFKVERIYGSGYIPPLVARVPRVHKVAKKVEDVILKMPGHQLLGVSYTVIARKQ